MKSSITKFNLLSGLSEERKTLQRHTSHMKGMYYDHKELESLVQGDDPLVYEFYDLGVKATEGNLAYGTSMVFPGKVGDEFYMTKGHFHTILDTSEIYYCLSGFGMMLMENPEGDVEYQVMRPGDAVFVPGRYAHRSINLSPTEKLVTFFVFRADAGHDYGSIEGRGFRKLVLDDGKGGFKVVENPKWGKSK